MKHFLITLAAILCNIGFMAAQTSDNTSGIIVTEGGETMKVHYVEVGGNTVFYQLDANSPIERIPVAEIMIIKYDNGEKWMPGQNAASDTKAKTEPTASDAGNGPVFINPTPSAGNEALIKEYNTCTIKYVKNEPNGKYSRLGFVIWNIGPNSIISDDNIEINFSQEDPDVNKGVSTNWFANTYRISITNKTNSNVYVDLANCFKIDSNGAAEPYFTNSAYTQTNSTTMGAGMNLGAVAGALGIGGSVGALASGLNVGGAKSSGTQVTTMEQRVLVIPPHGTVSLPGTKVSNGKSFVEVYEDFSIADVAGVSTEGLGVKQWTRNDYTEANSPAHIRRLITYSTDQNFAKYTTLPVDLYVGIIIGCGGTRFIGPAPCKDEVEGTARIFTLDKFNKK